VTLVDRPPEVAPNGEAGEAAVVAVPIVDSPPHEQPVAWRHRHLLDVDTLDWAELKTLMAVADDFAAATADPARKLDVLRGVNVTILFYEASTRTRVSFEVAAKKLGADVVSVTASGSSVTKGESLIDTVRTLEATGTRMLVIRHATSGAPYLVPRIFRGNVINGGDGWHGHPTQALLDLYTIYRERPLDGLSVAIIGELDKGRTARSLAYLLAKFERVKIFFVSPPELQMKPDILEYLDEHGVIYDLEPELERMIGEVDVVYQTRIRPERVRDAELLRRYAISPAVLPRMKSSAMILHPLPRTVELDKTVDSDPRAFYFRQAANGLFVRMALLTMLLDKD